MPAQLLDFFELDLALQFSFLQLLCVDENGGSALFCPLPTVLALIQLP